MDSNTFKNNVLKDVKAELDDEFDRNFERKAFFDQPWPPTSKNYLPTDGSLLLRSGALRRSIRSRIGGTSITYSSSLPYSGLMNYGGTVRQDFMPTPKMRRWAWANFYALRLAGKTAEADKYRRIALAKRIRRTFTVPPRPFIGDHPRVREIALNVVSGHAAKAVEREARLFPKFRNK